MCFSNLPRWKIQVLIWLWYNIFIFKATLCKLWIQIVDDWVSGELEAIRNHFSPSVSIFYWPEWATVEGWWQGHDGVNDRQQAEEQHEQQQAHVEVVGPWRLENSLMRNVTAHHCPALIVHRGQETQNVQTHQTWSIKRSHPEENSNVSTIISKSQNQQPNVIWTL